jgi:hypothetical protein
VRKVKLLKAPKFDLGALLGLHGESSADDSGQKVRIALSLSSVQLLTHVRLSGNSRRRSWTTCKRFDDGAGILGSFQFLRHERASKGVMFTNETSNITLIESRRSDGVHGTTIDTGDHAAAGKVLGNDIGI